MILRRAGENIFVGHVATLLLAVILSYLPVQGRGRPGEFLKDKEGKRSSCRSWGCLIP